jgi:hypothetical protein
VRVDSKTASVELSSDVPVAVADSRSEGEQLAELRSAAIERSRAANAGEYSFNHPASYFESLVGEQSSEFDLGTLKTASTMLQLPGLYWASTWGNHWVWRQGRYNGRTGRWVSDGQEVTIVIEDLRKAVDERIASLGLSKLAVYVWALSAHHHDEAKVFWSQHLEDRIKPFRRERTGQTDVSEARAFDL